MKTRISSTLLISYRYRCESGIAIFSCRLAWTCNYSPFNIFRHAESGILSTFWKMPEMTWKIEIGFELNANLLSSSCWNSLYLLSCSSCPSSPLCPFCSSCPPFSWSIWAWRSSYKTWKKSWILWLLSNQEIFPVYVTEPGNYSSLRNGNWIFSGLRNKNLIFSRTFQNSGTNFQFPFRKPEKFRVM